MSQPATSSGENRLARETSPYLLQHKDNPVDWWPWGPDALAEAARSNRPILLSVGYAACHWCHVMAHESFEDAATAQVMNELFVNIKVDREERPDIDQIYMMSLHQLGEQGGWPLTMFLTSKGEPVWGGTYFPNVTRYGRPAFVDVLREIARLFREEPERIDHNRAALMERLAQKARPAGRLVIGRAELDRVARGLAGAIDPVHGGLRGAPKFPQCAMLETLWRAGRRSADVPFFAAAELSLIRMCEGGIYDHLGGGFSRYSVDERWLVPHFEKMLYDNAQILELLALAFRRSDHHLFRQRAHETVAWLQREMTTEEGAFAASLDADSEGEEGKFYVWSAAEIGDLLGKDDAQYFAQHYDVSTGGNFEGHNILNRLKYLDDSLDPAPAPNKVRPAGQFGRHNERSMNVESRLAALRYKLLAARGKRVRPGLDDKVLADWNGLMIAALAHSGLAFGEPAWIAMARGAFDFIAGAMTRGERLGHSWRAGRLVYPGLASDFAAMVRAALALHEATGERAMLERALAWQTALETHYVNAHNGGYFLTADDAEGLLLRPDSTHDDAIPNPNGLIAQNLVRLAVLSGDAQWRSRAERLFDGLLPLAAENMFGHMSLLNALDMRLHAAEIVVTGTGPAAEGLLAAARAVPFIDRIVVHAASADALAAGHPAREKIAIEPVGAAFVCVGETCSLPVREAAQLPAALTAMRA
ncbi:MAG: thioredoxin domain-containing protein [Proteobacteria bacterium]|nr:thioredoxin domain-containing protein [Pseudomonadota bacterium]